MRYFPVRVFASPVPQMGLGKTVQSIAFLAHLWEKFCPRPHLVVVPLSTMRNWEREFALWAPQLNVVALSGSADARKVRVCGVRSLANFVQQCGLRTACGLRMCVGCNTWKVCEQAGL